jgi:hypothetical protein
MRHRFLENDRLPARDGTTASTSSKILGFDEPSNGPLPAQRMERSRPLTRTKRAITLATLSG